MKRREIGYDRIGIRYDGMKVKVKVNEEGTV